MRVLIKWVVTPTSILAGALVAVSVTMSGWAQIAPPKPTPEQLEAAFKEDQLGDRSCGIPRNAADDYRPTPAFDGQTRAARVSGKQPYKVEVVASGLDHPFALAFLPSGRLLVTIRPVVCAQSTKRVMCPNRWPVCRCSRNRRDWAACRT